MRWLAALLLALVVPAAAAQPVRGVVAETRLVRDLNRYRYDGLLTVGLAPGPWEIGGAGRFASDAFELFGGQLTFRDEVNLRMQAVRTLSQRLALGAVTRTQSFSQSRVLNHQSGAVVQFRPSAALYGELEAGLALDQRPGVSGEVSSPALRSDGGPRAAARIAFAPRPEEYVLEANAHAGWAQLTPRRSADAGFDVAVERQFDQTLFAARVFGSRVRRDAYQAASFLNRTDGLLAETVEATTSDTLLAALQLDVPLAGVVRFRSQVDLGVNARRVRTQRASPEALYFDTDFSRQALAYEGSLVAARPGLEGRLSVRTGAETERRLLVNRDGLPPAQAAQKTDLLRQADHDRSHFGLALTVQGSRGRVSGFAEAAASILRHDTPEINPDDRDEAQQSASAGVQWRPRPALAFSTTAFGSSYHTVYLKRQRSGENNRQRSLRLRPAVVWTPAPLSRVSLTSEVRATYTVADVVLPGRSAEDQAARELRYELDAEHAFTPVLRMRGRATFSDLRLGRLVRERFAEIPFDTLHTYTLDLRAQVVRRLTAEVGVRLFLRRDFERSVAVRYPRRDEAGLPLLDEAGQPVLGSIARPGRTWRRQIGPVVRLSWPLGADGSAVELDGWYAMQRLSSRLFGTLPEAAEADIRAAARRGQRDLYPNLSLTVRWAIR